MDYRFSALYMQRKYNVGYHGPERRSDNLDGIVTLTNDSIAIRHDQELKEIWKDIRSKEEIEKKIFETSCVPKEAITK